MNRLKWIHLSLGFVLIVTSLLSVTPAAMQDDPPPASIDLEKYISVDGGVTWLDADVAGPDVNVGDMVLFRVFVMNTGEADLSNIVLTDTQFDVESCSVQDELTAGSFFGCDFGPVEAVEGEYTNTATITAESDLGTVTDSDSAGYVGGIDEEGDDDDIEIVITIEGPVEDIDIDLGIIVIFGIEVQIDPDDPILIVLEIGDEVRVEGAVDENIEGDVVVIVAVTVILIDIEIYIDDDGDTVFRDDGNCGNPPPDWAPAWGWRRKCEGVVKPKKK